MHHMLTCTAQQQGLSFSENDAGLCIKEGGVHYINETYLYNGGKGGGVMSPMALESAYSTVHHAGCPAACYILCLSIYADVS